MDATHPMPMLAELLGPQDRTDCALTPDDARLRLQVGGVAFDSRRVHPHDLFFAYPGRAHDGHDHAGEAVRRGATAVVGTRPLPHLRVPQLLHPDPKALMGRVARALHHDPAAALKVVAITGTNGKTTTAHLVASMLAAAWGKAGLLGTLGAATVTWDQTRGPTLPPYSPGAGLTTPEAPELLACLAQFVRAQVPAVVLEASSIALVEDRLREVPCDVALLTNITQDHLDYHGTMAAYRAAKAELFLTGRKPRGASVWPRALAQDHWAPLPTDGVLQTFDGSAPEACDPPADVALLPAAGDQAPRELAVRTPRGVLRLTTPLFGRFNEENVLAAIAVGEALMLPHAAMAAGIAQMAPVPGRLEPVTADHGGPAPLVLVDFAHTPDALGRVLQAVRERCAGRLLLVVGCGGDRDRAKRPLMGGAAASADTVWLTSDNPRSEDPHAIAQAMLAGLRAAARAVPWHIELDRAQAIAQAVRHARAGDVVLVAGKGHEDYQLVAGRKTPFDDRAEARKALHAWLPGGAPP